MPNPTPKNWWNPIHNANWYSKMFGNVFNWMYQDLLVPWFESNGYQVVAGNRNPQTGKTVYPMLVNAKTKKSVRSYNYLLKKNNNYYIGYGNFWPNFSNNNNCDYKTTYKTNPFFFNFNPKDYQVKVGNAYYPIAGKFLYWWDKGNVAQYKKHNVNWIWSIRECIWTMANNGNPSYYNWVRNYRSWFNNYWNSLAWGNPVTAAKPKTKAKAKPTTTAKPKTTAKAKPKTTAKAKPVAKAKPKPVAKAKPKTTAKAKPVAKAKPKTTAKKTTRTAAKRTTTKVTAKKPVLKIVNRKPAHKTVATRKKAA